PGMPRWESRSTLVELDRDALRLVHRSQTDDGNPSYGIWTWTVTPVDDAAELTIRWDAYPQTFWRRVLFSRIRRRPLASELRWTLSRSSSSATRTSGCSWPTIACRR